MALSPDIASCDGDYYRRRPDKTVTFFNAVRWNRPRESSTSDTVGFETCISRTARTVMVKLIGLTELTDQTLHARTEYPRNRGSRYHNGKNQKKKKKVKILRLFWYFILFNFILQNRPRPETRECIQHKTRVVIITIKYNIYIYISK